MSILSKNGRGRQRAEDSMDVKFLSRTREYKGEKYVDYVASFEMNGKTVLVSLPKKSGGVLEHHVVGAKEKKNQSEDLYVVYGRITVLGGGGGK